MATLHSPGDAVKALRKEFGQSQQAFATMLGVSIASIAHYETGSRSPDYRIGMKLLRAAKSRRRQDVADYLKSWLKSKYRENRYTGRPA